MQKFALAHRAQPLAKVLKRTCKMTNSLVSIKKQLVETQSVEFIIDQNADFSGLDSLNLGEFPKIFAFIDQNIYKAYDGLIRKISLVNPNTTWVQIDADEEAKDISQYAQYINTLSHHKCSKKDLILAIGGGVLLDIGGFVASTYMRGVNLYMIPTTLCGQIDASTAGKTCMNTSHAKNLIGTFYLPQISYNNTHFLKTCTEYVHRQGLSEVFKYGLLGSQGLIDKLLDYQKAEDPNLLAEIIKEAIEIRFNVRTYDPLASNLGHTFGHALEKHSDFKVAHGDAISVGTVMALKFSLEKGIITLKLFQQILNWMEKLSLNRFIDSDVSADKIADLMCRDKKSNGDSVGLILITDVGQPLRYGNLPFYYVQKEEIKNFVDRFIKDSDFSKSNHWELLR